MCGCNNFEIHGRFNVQLTGYALQWRMSINIKWLFGATVLLEQMACIYKGTDEYRRNGVLGNWYDSRSRIARGRCFQAHRSTLNLISAPRSWRTTGRGGGVVSSSPPTPYPKTVSIVERSDLYALNTQVFHSS